MTNIKPMGNKDIDKAAREYAENRHGLNRAWATDRIESSASYAAGAEWGMQSRQSEIDELIEALEEMRWIHRTERHPNDQRMIMVKSDNGSISTAYFHGPISGFIVYGDDAYMEFGDVLYWREIDTPKATQLLEKYGKK